VTRRDAISLMLAEAGALFAQAPDIGAPRLVALKVDGLGADLLSQTMQEINPATGKSWCPWLTHIFSDNGMIFDNFYVRGISLSAPSWSMLDTGRHLLVKGNVEYDRFTGRVYDYLNFFPFYLGYARSREVDMPSVRVLDEAGVPLLSDQFSYQERYQSFQLFQRGVRWKTLQHGIERRLSTSKLLSLIEDPQGGLRLEEGLARQTEADVLHALQNSDILYVDLFTGDIDHTGHSINDPRILRLELQKLDSLAAKIWTAIQASPLASRTIFVMVSDHGMNNVPGLYSQTFNIPDLLNSPAGGAHHVITNRHQLSDYKIAGLDPLVSRVVNPSTASLYLKDQANDYPTAWLDLDGNERAAICLRNSDLNQIQILLQQLSRTDLPDPLRLAATAYFCELLDRKRPGWTETISELGAELDELGRAIAIRQENLKSQPKHWPKRLRRQGLDKEARRKLSEVKSWIEEQRHYRDYLDHLRAILDLRPDGVKPLPTGTEHILPPRSLGDHNSVFDIQNYVAGPAPAGLVIDGHGRLDEAKSFSYVDYFPLLAAQTVRNVPQRGLSAKPIDFMLMALPPSGIAANLSDGPSPLAQAIWLYGGAEHQLVELVRHDHGQMWIRVIPVAGLRQSKDGQVSWSDRAWAPGFPLRLFEDPNLAVPDAIGRASWLSAWHSEWEWFQAIHRCRYSNGVIGVTEDLLPPSQALPERPGLNPLLRRLEIRRRQLVQADFHIFATDHWNFNVRNFNPGGNHGSFLRMSTHSVWMMAGPSIPRGRHIREPHDSLNFASTLLAAAGKRPPMPDRIVNLK
jgi:Type I phosphodiesterase / nucleotide pyrophosphatase